MRTITKTYQLYTLNELSEESQQVAYQNWLNNFYYGYSEDNLATLKAFKDLFNLSIRDVEYNECLGTHSPIICSDDIPDISGARLTTYIHNHFGYALFKRKTYFKRDKKRVSKIMYHNDCVLTGYYMDAVILEPVYEFLLKPTASTTFHELMYWCIDKYLKACVQDVQGCMSLEGFIGNDDNEYLSDGTIFVEQ